MKKRNKIAVFVRKNRSVIIVGSGLLLFPLIIDVIYHIPIDWFYIRESDLLQFYGVALGIYFSCATYIYEREKARKSRNSELKPCIAVNLRSNENGYFEITLSKVEDGIITDLFLFDEPLDNILKAEQTYKVRFYPDNEVSQILDLSGYDKNLMDSDGYPKYILLSCCDAENRMWQGEYIKLSNGNEKIYVLKDMYLV